MNRFSFFRHIGNIKRHALTFSSVPPAQPMDLLGKIGMVVAPVVVVSTIVTAVNSHMTLHKLGIERRETKEKNERKRLEMYAESEEKREQREKERLLEEEDEDRRYGPLKHQTDLDEDSQISTSRSHR